MALIHSKQLNPKFTGSFTLSGSNQTFVGSSEFQGSITASSEISSSSTITANTFVGIFNGALSSSAQIASNISGSFTSVSSSLAARLTSEEGEAEGSVVSSSNQIATDISGSWRGELSSSVYLRQVSSTISGSFTETSASIASDITEFKDGTVTLVSGSSTSTGSFGELEVDTNTTVGGDLFVSQFIKHTGDSNTYLNFTDDRLRFNIGGISYIDLNDATSAPHDITFNDGGNNVDFTIKGTSNNPLFKTDASTNRIGTHGKGTPEVAFHIGGSELRVDGTISGSDYGGNISGSVTSTGSFGELEVDTNTTIGGDLFVKEYIKHTGDVNTAIRFTDNKISFDAGGMTFFAVHDDDSAPFTATINGGGNKINFRALDENQDILLKTDSEAFSVELYHAGNKKLETTSTGINVTGHITASGGGAVTGDFSVGGTLTAQEIHTEFTSASIIFTSGSTKFGDTMDDVHTMTGSLTVTGSVTADNFSGTFDGALSSSNQIATDISGSFRGELSSSVYLRQVATTISGSFTSVSQSLAARITSEEGEAEGSVVSSSNQIATDISGSWRGELSSSVYLRQVASTISGSLGSNATLIRSLTAAGISGSIAEPSGNVSGSSTSTGSFGNINVGNVDVGGRITHNGDTDTRILFTDDDINITVGGLNMIDFTQDTVSEITINEEGVDLDFRVEGDNDANLLFIDGGNDKIGIGTNSSLTSLLTIDGDITTTHVTASGDISGSSTSTGSFGKVIVSEMGNSDLTIVSSSISTRLTTAESELGNTLISSSAQIATDISGSFRGELSSSVYLRQVEETVSGSWRGELSSSVYLRQVASTISGSITSTSASIASDINEFKNGTITLVSGSSTSTGSFGRVEAAGVVFADSFVSSTGGSTIDFNDDVSLAGSLTTTGKIELGREPVQGFNYLARLAEGEVSASSKAHTFTVTNASKTSNHPYKNLGSGQGYVIDGVETPFLYLTEGYYKFDYSAASSHPVRFYFNAGKTTEYNPSSHVSVDGNVVTLKIDKDSPQILYYQCSSHGYMGWAIHTGQNSLLQDANGMKVVVSGSNQIASDISGSWRGELSSSVYLRQVAATISGSRNAGAISGSFRGELSSSVYLRQVATTISGSITSTSSSIASDIASNLSSINTNTTNITTNTTNISTLTSKSGSYAITGSNHFKANQIISGSLTVTDTIIAQEFKTEFISASITFTSGSTKFGDSSDDLHRMTGSLKITGSFQVDNGTSTVNALTADSVTTSGNISGSSTSTGSFGVIEVGGGHFTSASLAAGGGSSVNSEAVSGSWRGELSSSVYLRQVATTISGSLGSNASLIRSLTANSISGSWRGELSSSAITVVGGGVSGSSTSTGSFGKLLGDASSLTNLPSAAITNYASSGDNRIITSVNSTNVQGEANLTFDGTSLTLTGNMTSSGDISGSSTSTGSFGVIEVGGGHFTSASLAAGGGGSSTNVDATSVSGSWRGELSSSSTTFVGGGVSGSSTSTGSFGRVEATRFIGDGSGLSNVAASITVKEEGTDLTTALSSMNFVGDGITATTSGNDVTVTQALTKGAGDATVIDVSSASTTWEVTHSLDNKYPTVTIYDENNQVIIPESITADTVNTATITFEQAVSGKASFTLGIPTSSLFISSSTQLLNQIANSTISGDLDVTGTLTAQEFHTEVTSASIIFTSGSNKFGNSMDDVHNFTGSVNVTGSVTADSFSGTFNGSSFGSTPQSNISGSWRGELSSSVYLRQVDGTISGSWRGELSSSVYLRQVEETVSGSWRGELSSSSTTFVGGGVSGSSVSSGSFGEVRVGGMSVKSLTAFSSSVATKLNTLDADIIALSIALG